MTTDEQVLSSRMAEVYAGFLSHGDAQIGRLVDHLEEIGQLDNTIIIVVSDNGASGEGGPNGSVNEMLFMNGIPDTMANNLTALDELGGLKTYNHYSTGWAMAFNTPFKMWKRYASFEGGTADPCIISWPAGITAQGEVREQYHHAIDIVPTVLDCLQIPQPDVVKGVTQIPIQGVSMRYSFDAPALPSERHTQFYSMLGTRAIYHDGWKAVTTHPAIGGWGHFEKDTWELYHSEVDRAELHDLAAENPDKLTELIGLWFYEAGINHAFPLDDRTALEIILTPRPQLVPPRGPLHLPTRRSRGPRVGRGQHPQPVLHDRRAGRHPGGRPRAGCAVRPRQPIRRSQPVRQGQPAGLRLQLRRHQRTTNRRHRRTSPPERTCCCRPASTRPASNPRASRRAPCRCTTANARSAKATSKPSPASSPSAAKASTSAATAAHPSPPTTPATRPGPSPAAPCTASPSTSAETPSSTSNAKPSPCSPANSSHTHPRSPTMPTTSPLTKELPLRRPETAPRRAAARLDPAGPRAAPEPRQ